MKADAAASDKIGMSIIVVLMSVWAEVTWGVEVCVSLTVVVSECELMYLTVCVPDGCGDLVSCVIVACAALGTGSEGTADGAEHWTGCDLVGDGDEVGTASVDG